MGLREHAFGFGEALAALVWLLLLAWIIAFPYIDDSPTRGDDLTRRTVRLALAYYAAAATLLLVARPADAGRRPLARCCWTLGWAAYLVHLAMAFHHYHHWSHADAVEHTRQVSGVGEGIYVSHQFTLAWTADVVAWWLWPRWYAARPRWVAWALHGFLAFVIFNGTVVYETGPIRWAGVALFAWLGALVLYRILRRWVARLEQSEGRGVEASPATPFEDSGRATR